MSQKYLEKYKKNGLTGVTSAGTKTRICNTGPPSRGPWIRGTYGRPVSPHIALDA